MNSDHRAAEVPDVRKRSFRWKTRAATLPAMASVVAVAILLSSGSQTPPVRTQPDVGAERGEFSLAAIQVAESAPRYLVDLPGWKVVAANQFTGEQGQITFSNGVRRLEINWSPPNQNEQKRLADLDRVNADIGTLDIHGARVLVFESEMPVGAQYSGHWLHGDHELTARGEFPSYSDFVEVIKAFRIENVEGWLAAMPEQVVGPDSRSTVVDEMLADIPLPPGLGLEAVRSEAGVLERYHLGARVVSEVTCGWINTWRHARESGDLATAQRATDAMATLRDWGILREMESQGGYSTVIWQLADAMPDDGQVPAGRPMTLSEVDLKSTLGCDG